MKEKFKSFITKHSEIWKFIKFTFTGASTSVLELAVFALLQYVVFKILNNVPVTDNAVLSFLKIEYNNRRWLMLGITNTQENNPSESDCQ